MLEIGSKLMSSQAFKTGRKVTLSRLSGRQGFYGSYSMLLLFTLQDFKARKAYVKELVS